MISGGIGKKELSTKDTIAKMFLNSCEQQVLKIFDINFKHFLVLI